ncbi:hypothetical protein NS303_12345 [Pantoea ananatis]|nr:hypothetical protein NS303_12345 [Pantoea ananatis]KTR52417.1 hypothetical protein NS311_20295 [Pantoea ananatis]KTR63017.1 hypothetical protein RSA47_19235 [Pantoea ananatis]KTR68032.1 hypothetical protein NS296_20230 [Pantoea ananatis]PZD62436.1 hypothetical protein ARC310_11340 [Pantoea ananatis]
MMLFTALNFVLFRRTKTTLQKFQVRPKAEFGAISDIISASVNPNFYTIQVMPRFLVQYL